MPETIAQKYTRLWQSGVLTPVQAIQKLKEFCMSQTLQRRFQETQRDFLKRCPAVRLNLAECAATITMLENHLVPRPVESSEPSQPSESQATSLYDRGSK